MNSLPGQPIKTIWASSFNAWTNNEVDLSSLFLVTVYFRYPKLILHIRGNCHIHGLIYIFVLWIGINYSGYYIYSPFHFPTFKRIPSWQPCTYQPILYFCWVCNLIVFTYPIVSYKTRKIKGGGGWKGAEKNKNTFM